MGSKKVNGSRKDPSKTPKVWERARREKMKIYFNELQEVLPFYDPSAPMSRLDILLKSKTYIKDLQEQNQDLLNGGFDEVYKNKMIKLKQRVKELLKRVDQLTDLLRTANIMIPPLEAYPECVGNTNSFKWMSQRPKKWTEKINLVVPDEKIKSVLTLIKDYKKNSGKVGVKRKQNVKNLQKSENLSSGEPLQKPLVRKKKLFKKGSQIVKSAKVGTDNSKKNDSFSESQSPSQFKENQPVDFNLLSNEPVVSKSSTNTQQSTSVPTEANANIIESTNKQMTAPIASVGKITIPQKFIETPQNVILPSTTNVLQSNTFILTNDGSLVQLPVLNPTGTVFNTNSNLLTQAAIVKPSTGLLTPLVINKPSPVIVLQKPQPQIIQTAQIINAAPQVISVSKSNVQILGSSVVYTSSSPVTAAKTLPHILSKAPANKKRIARDSTVTTYVNKIPIPALSKQSYSKKAAPVNTKDKCANVKTKDVVEKQSEGSENVQNKEKDVVESNQQQNDKVEAVITTERNENRKEKQTNSTETQKRDMVEEKVESHKKQKLNNGSMVVSSEENVFKPIENPINADGMFCSLALPNAMNPSLSVSPTAAFLSSFPIVAPTRSEADDDISERKTDEGKEMQKEAHDTQITTVRKNDPPLLALGKSNASLTGLGKNDTHLTLMGKNDNQLTSLGKGGEITNGNKEVNKLDIPKDHMAKSADAAIQTPVHVQTEKVNETTKEQLVIPPISSISSHSIANMSNNNRNNLSHQLEPCKTWEQFQHDNCEIRSETFYMPPESIQINNSIAPIEPLSAPVTSFTDIPSNMADSYKPYPTNTSRDAQNNLNEQLMSKSNHFEYSQKDTYLNKTPGYNTERPVMKKQCTNNIPETYNVPKTQANSYQLDSGPNYQLIPAKEATNQRNSRTVNWMTEPDVRNRGMIYGSQSDKMITAKAPIYTQPDNFYMNNQTTKTSTDYPGHFVPNDQNKMNYQKNEFYGKDQRYKNIDKRSDNKCYTKTPQNTYNIFDYNYAGCYTEEDSGKYCNNVQSYPVKNKKNITHQKKKSEEVHHVNTEHTNDPTKRPTDQIITNLDFNPVPNQECFTWVPGKNVEWLPSKSFCLDSNLVVPSTLPTLVGDLALGTTSTNDINHVKTPNSKICHTNLKPNGNDITKDYIDLGMVNSTAMSKPMEVMDTNKQYLEPFANLSKNIFDVTPSNMQNTQMPKNDFDKINFVGNNNNETIVLKNIFELPVSKSSTTDFNRNKQRNITNSQNTFLSVSQLVEPPIFEQSTMKNDTQMESTTAKTDPYAQNYPNYNQKTYKNKTRSSHCKYNDRKYHGYKNGSSSYTAEALIRSNTNVNYQSNEFTADINTNFFNGKTNTQKPEQFSGNNKIDFELNMKSDFGTGPSQNIYSDFNFSSPVPNFSIPSSVGTDFVTHDTSGNFTAQNNSFFGDFITPEYPLSESVSNSLLLPPCSIALQNPFVLDKRNSAPTEKNKNTSKQYSTSRNRKHYECAKTSYNDFSIPPTSAIFTTSSITCPTIFTTSACQNLLPVPTQSIPITFSSPSFTTGNISFPPLPSTSTNNSYHRFTNSSQNSTSGTFLPSNTMFTTGTTKPLSTTHNCYSSSNPLTSVTNSVISSSFPVGNVPFSASSQSSIPFFSLSNPIIPSSAPTSSSNSLANFNLSTIFPEINQKGNYHYS